MSYIKQNFYTNQILRAEHLNNIENGIIANENAIADKQPKGNYATQDFVTSKIAEAQLSGGNGNAVDLTAYPTKEEVAASYQLKGDYVTKESADSDYQPKGDYVTNDIVAGSYQPKGNYLTEHQKLKTINGETLVGAGNIEIKASGDGGEVVTAPAVNYDLNVKAVNHRGYSTDAPENTIPAYIMSKEKGFTYVECDVAFTSDNVAVLLHDATIDRTSNGSGSLSKLTYEQVLQYDFGSWFSSNYSGVKIPTFTEFIVLCKRLGLHPYIELKSSDNYTQEQITQIVDEVEKCGMTGKVTYISFNNTFLGYVKNADAYARLGLLANPINSTKINQAVALKTGTNEVFMDAKLAGVTNSLIDSCISNGLPLEVWTVNTEKEILGMPAYVSGVTSDNLVAGKVLYEAAMVYIPPVSSYVPTTGVTLSQSTLTFNELVPQTLTATIEPSNSSDAVVWNSTDTNVATVSDGVVTPINNGSCTITATAGGISASCSVSVALTEYTITRTLSGCTSTSTNTTILKDKSLTETIVPNAGYSIKNATVSITLNGTDITNSCYNNGVISIENVTGDIVINIACVEVPVYTITRSLTNCTSNSSLNEIGSGNPHSETFTADANYTLEDATVVITMGGADISSNYVNGTLTIAEVTGNIDISVVATKAYTIVRNLEGCQSSSTATSVKEGMSHTETITSAERYSLDGATITITMGGVDITDKYVDGTLTITEVTGDIVISITAVAIITPVVDLALANVTDGVLRNTGYGGSTYSATITDGNYTSNADGLTLLTKASASIPYGFKATDKFTIFIKGSFDELNTQNYQRMMRTNKDMPSLFYRKSDTDVCAKLAGKSGSGYTVHNNDLATWPSDKNCLSIPIDTIGLGTQHTYTWVGNGSKIYFYVDGALTASQNSSPLETSTSIGLGNNDNSASYYANQITISAFRIYNVAMTAEQVAALSA